MRWVCTHYYCLLLFFFIIIYIPIPHPPTHPQTLPTQSSRHFFCSTLARSLVPLCAVSWADFLLADMLTSLAKPMADLSRATCHLARRDVMATFDEVGGMRGDVGVGVGDCVWVFVVEGRLGITVQVV